MRAPDAIALEGAAEAAAEDIGAGDEPASAEATAAPTIEPTSQTKNRQASLLLRARWPSAPSRGSALSLPPRECRAPREAATKPATALLLLNSSPAPLLRGALFNQE